MRSLLILNYHQIRAAGDREDSFSVTVADLAMQLQLLKESGVPVVPLNSTERNTVVPEDCFSVSITFDDGHYSDIDKALPLLDHFGFTAAFFPLVNAVGSSGKLNRSDLEYLSSRDFRIGSHGLTHRPFTQLSVAEQRMELGDSKRQLEEWLQKPVTDFALPFGAYGGTTVKLATETGYTRVLTTGLKIIKGTKDVLLSRWNLRSNTTTNYFEKILHRSGRLDPVTRLSAGLKQQAKRWLGHRTLHYLNELT